MQQEVVERGCDARRHGLAQPRARYLGRAQPNDSEAAVRRLQVVPHLLACATRLLSQLGLMLLWQDVR